MNRRSAASLLILATVTPAVSAQAQYADPPDRTVVVDQSTAPIDVDTDPTARAWSEPSRSSVRLSTGPALRVGQQDPRAGLAAAVDLGRDAGFRLSGAWVGTGSAEGLAKYGGELWLDLGRASPLHPIIGAGAGVAVVQTTQTAAATEKTTLGVGLLRASLEYELPVAGTDARAGVDAVGTLPAVTSERTGDLNPWLLLFARVCVGF